MSPSAFISYSRDSEIHKEWVARLAARLRSDGVDAKLDQWETVPGDQLPQFMERSIREYDFVLIVCTPDYKRKSDNRQGGVGYEGDIMTADVFNKGNHRKYIPVLRAGPWAMAAPSWICGKYHVDMSSEDKIERGYDDLLATIYGARPQAPPLGETPPKFKISGTHLDMSKMKPDKPIIASEITIKGVVVDEVTEPRNDGARGCTLYRIPFQLSERPPYEWGQLFVQNWNHPPRWTSMHRPRIAFVSGDKIILDGTTIEEVEKYHRDTLILAVSETNKMFTKLMAKQREETKRKQAKATEHMKNVDDIAGRLKF